MSLLLSVIVPTCGRAKALGECLGLLNPEYQGIDPSLYELIVTDDSRDDSSRNLLSEKHQDIKWSRGPARGPAANRNHGASLASGSWLVFLDDDCIPSAGLLDTYRRAVSLSAWNSVYEGRISPIGKKTRLDQQAPINERGGLLWSCNFCISRELFGRLNGFDEAFGEASMEDVDLRERILQGGGHIDFLPQAAVRHPWQRKKGRSFVRSHAASLVYFCTKHERMDHLATPARLQTLARLLFNAFVKEGWRCGWRGGLRFAGLSFYSLYSIRKILR